MTQIAIPYHFLRGGSSRGPYFNRADLPQDLDTLANVLVAVVGAGHPHNIDGIGGGTAVTTKVAMLSRSETPDADVDYFFAQVSVEEPLVDFKPTCGNILSGVGPAAIEMGLVEPQGDKTRVRIRAVNTGARVEAIVDTPDGKVNYEGDTAIDGVPGTAAPVFLNFLDVVGSSCGALLPTGNLRDTIDGYEVTCMDVAMPMVIGRAADFGITGYETAADLDADRELMARIEAVRLEAGRRMGMGDVAKSVTPKFGLIAPARDGGTFAARYFMPWNCHPTMAVTGSQCLASCALTPGTVADGLVATPEGVPALVLIEHPMGQIDVTVDYENGPNGFELRSAGLVRTARLLARGEVLVPERAFTAKTAKTAGA
ncbi:4-oxalomesaconate tautomerase [Polymorphum gilvum]|uniref:Methylitaconate delta2-delta3-isomerase n=1 Tax=Polymorphum gilvum (strain LMG 25793 / CGMCC 1.9160 / SL003B-26A1) TaxID=991905 RepID=F2J3Z4_POLGS|nr:4-oxalomesaconate tautomerase [Polymorphum gilvum]ADZ68976.1 Methylitaconate delta2-delta3-isomerase [Polymorphum gilvum SL003B-26A1]